MITKAKIVAGILTSKRAFTGPGHVDVDITRKCNAHCIVCPYYSPLLDDPLFKRAKSIRQYGLDLEKIEDLDKYKKEEIDFEIFKKLIDDLKDIGTRGITFSGEGEPFMHSKILDLITYVKNKNMHLGIITCGVPLKEKMAEEMVEVGVDSIDFSLLAGTPEVYVSTHPLSNEKTFERIKHIITYIQSLKSNKGRDKPLITFHDVICNKNFQDVDKIVELGVELRVAGVGIVPYKAWGYDIFKTLELNKQQQKYLSTKLFDALKIAENNNISTNINDYFKYFLKIDEGSIKNVYSKIPCYAGWLMSRILLNGDVIPCCGCYKPMGNIFKNSFKEIWYSKEYNAFRVQSKNISRRFPVQFCECYECPDTPMNVKMYKLLHPLNFRSLKTFDSDDTIGII